MLLYNPKNGATFDTESDDELHNAVYFEMGWKPAPEPTEREGYEPEPVTYVPVGSMSASDSYSNWTKDQLADELEDRGLPKSGSKDELVDRLIESDQETE